MKIKTKIFAYTFLTLAAFSFVIFLHANYLLSKDCLKKAKHHLEEITGSLASQSEDLILTNDLTSLLDLFISISQSHPYISYIFAESDQEIMASTFNKTSISNKLDIFKESLNLGSFPRGNKNDISIIKDAQNGATYHFRRKIDGLDSGIIHVGLPVQKVKDELASFRKHMFLVVIIFQILALGPAYLLARGISKPILLLCDGARRIGNGELDYRLELKTGDEIEQLVNEENRMAAKLAEYYANLEQRVAERTEKLEKEIINRKMIEERLKYMALYDSLTCLPNRNMFFDHLTHAIAQAKRYNHILALLFLDLDNFKLINDNLGHRAGDLLLIEIAKRLKSVVRDSDIVARMSGDEFTIILTQIDSYYDARQVAVRVINLLAEPFCLDGQECVIGVSIGSSFYPTNGDNIEILLQKADTAMYQAKENGGNEYQPYYHEVPIRPLLKVSF